MGRAVTRPCCWPGCPNTTASRWCDAHAAKMTRSIERDRRRRRGPRVYDTRRWRRLSASVLRQRPVCEQCGDELATQVDHVVPIDQAPERAFDRENLQALGDRCHGKKTRRGE